MATTWTGTAGVTISGGTVTAANDTEHAITADAATGSSASAITVTFTDQPGLFLTNNSATPVSGGDDWASLGQGYWIDVYNSQITTLDFIFVASLSIAIVPGDSVGISINPSNGNASVTVNSALAWSGTLTPDNYYFGVSLWTAGDTLTADLSNWGDGVAPIQIGDTFSVITAFSEAGPPDQHAISYITAYSEAGAATLTHIFGPVSSTITAHSIAVPGFADQLIGTGTTWGLWNSELIVDSETISMPANLITYGSALAAASVHDGRQIARFTIGEDTSYPMSIVLVQEYVIPQYGEWWDEIILYNNSIWFLLDFKGGFEGDSSVHRYQNGIPSRISDMIGSTIVGDTITIELNFYINELIVTCSRRGQIWRGFIDSGDYYLGLGLAYYEDSVAYDLSQWGPIPLIITRHPSPYSPTRFMCELSAAGLPSLALPMGSFQARTRSGEPSYLSVVIPSGTQYADAIAARAGGLLIVYSVQMATDGDPLLTEIARAKLNSIRSDEGSNSSSVTLTGYKQTTNAPRTVPLERWSYRAVTETGRRVRAPIQTGIRAGDTVLMGAESMVVREIAYTVNPSSAEMELAE